MNDACAECRPEVKCIGKRTRARLSGRRDVTPQHSKRPATSLVIQGYGAVWDLARIEQRLPLVGPLEHGENPKRPKLPFLPALSFTTEVDHHGRSQVLTWGVLGAPTEHAHRR